MENKFGISSNQLKILALISMTIDHIGLMLFPDILVLRIIGRLAMPIFAYLIAEGCLHTSNSLKYFLRIFILGIFCQVVYLISDNGNIINILLDFSISIIIISCIQRIKKSNNAKSKTLWILLAVFIVIATAVACNLMPRLTKKRWTFDYGFFGIMLPVLVYLFKNRWLKLIGVSVCMIMIWLLYKWVFWCGVFATIPLALYNGKRGRYNIKYLFYD